MSKIIRVVMAKPGLDGHDRGIKVLSRAFRDAGMEVVYLGLRQTPDMIVNAAVQEDADVIAISSLNNVHMTIFPRVLELMNEKNIGDRLLTGGGIIPDCDIENLRNIGVGELFGPGTAIVDIVNYIQGWVDEHRQ